MAKPTRTSVLDGLARQLAEYTLRNHTGRVGRKVADQDVTELTDQLIDKCLMFERDMDGREPDTSDIPEAGEEFFKKAKLRDRT